jgi:hypothetical protein
MACWIRRSTTVGTPSIRSPPSGLGIVTRRTGAGRYVPSSSCLRIATQFSRSHGRSSAIVLPSTPAAPRLRSTRFNARSRFSRENTISQSSSRAG